VDRGFGGYLRLEFGTVGDDASRDLVLGRIIEPTSDADTLRVLTEIGVRASSLPTLFLASPGASSETTSLTDRSSKSVRVMDTGKHARTRRIGYQYPFQRRKRDAGRSTRRSTARP
jgi:hypothetical protein